MTRRPQPFKLRALFVSVTLTLSIASPALADLNSQAQQMFTDLGAVGNVTKPQAFKGQTMNTYTGGSLFIRTPHKGYQLAAVQLPYIHAGCGGIDLFGGSFSHISSAELKNALKNVTSAIPGVIFQLLLKSVEPLLGSTVEYFQGLADMVNRQNIGSCEQITGMVNSAASKMGLDATSNCMKLATYFNDSGDVEGARTRCQDAGNVQSQNANARNNATTKDIPPFIGNLVWAQLKRQTYLDDSDRELIMSMTGTTIYSEVTDAAPAPDEKAPTINSISDLLYGTNAADVSCTEGNTCITVLSCGGDYTSCASPTEATVSIPSLITRVNNLMTSMAAKMQDRSGAPTVAEINFVNSVTAPIYRLLAVSTALPESHGIASAKIAQYSEYAAVEFAYSLLSRFARAGRNTASNLRLNDEQSKQLDRHRHNADALIATLHHEREIAESKMKTFDALAQDIERLQRTMHASMAQQIADVMNYSSMSGAR